ncbi:MAG: sulfur carrier protein ThiS [Phycisphaerales bacterium]
MLVTVNGEPRTLEPGTTVGALLAHLGLDKAICAAEVNHEVVPRRERDARELAEGDVVELVTLVGGG